MPIELLINQMNKQFGEGSVVKASDAYGLKIKRFSTGSYALDVALRGGLVEGRINEFCGKFSSFKSTVGVLSAQNYLNKYPESNAVIIDAEKSFELKWAKYLGADLKRFYIVRPDTGEQCVDALCDFIKQAHTDKKQSIIILDSIAGMVPFAELDNPAEKGLMGAHPRLVAKMCRKVKALMKGEMLREDPLATLLFINQVRVAMNVMYGDPETIPGGRALEHTVDVRIKLKSKDVIKEELKDKGEKSEQTVGTHLGFKVLKNKTAGGKDDQGVITFYNKDYNYCRGGTFDNAEDLLPLGVIYKFIERRGNGFSYRKISGPGREKFCKELYNNPKVLNNLYLEIMEHHSKRGLGKKEMQLGF